MNFRIDFSFLPVKNVIEILMEIALNIKTAFGSVAILSIISADP
jgi:hypothetical protein